jgi:SAM-dependent methyltransferase
MAATDDALRWQVGIWDGIASTYQREIDARFEGVVARCVAHAALQPGDDVLDLGTGTGAVAALAAGVVGPDGTVTAVDVSTAMLARARARVSALGLANVRVVEGRAEDLPVPDRSVDALIASLSLMYAIDREAAARECARVLRPGGRFVAAAWAGPDEADIVRFQQAAGTFAPPPPVPGVGPGALGDPQPFLAQLAEAGITADVRAETVTFGFDSLDHAWEILAAVTTADLPPDRRRQAKEAVRDAMWADPSTPRLFHNRTQFLVGRREA